MKDLILDADGCETIAYTFSIFLRGSSDIVEIREQDIACFVVKAKG